MKKKHLLGFLLSIFAFIFLSACNSPTTFNVNFKEKEYVLSVDESINFFDEINLNGKDTSLIELTSSDAAVIEGDGETKGLFKAKSSGQAYIRATYEGSVVAQVKVKVRYKFSSPSNFNIDELGNLTWTPSSVSRNGKHEKARSYQVSYALIENGVVGEISTQKTSANFFIMNHLPKGVYQISIQALTHSDEFDSSDIIQDNVNYGAMGEIENVAVANETLGGQATITWAEKDSAVYDVYVEGFKVAQDLEEETFTHDFSIYPTAQTIKVEVVAKPTGDKQAIETSTRLNLTKLATPGLSVSGGLVQLTEVSGASGYILSGEEPVGTIDLEKDRTFDFEGFDAGIYSFSALASGAKTKEDGLYLNSAASQEITIGKIPLPQFTVEIDGSIVRVTFEKPVFNGQEFDVEYRVTCKGISANINTTTARTYTMNVASPIFPAGNYDLTIEAYPLSGQTMTDENGNTANVLVKSDPVKATFYKLDSFGEITHSLDGDKSIISFDKIRFANHYQLSVNGELVDVEYQENNGRIEFAIENLAQRIPIRDTYTFALAALTKDGEKVVSTVSTATKTIQILQNTTTASSQTNGYYAWNAVDGAVYSYEVFETDNGGNIISDTPVITAERITENQTLDVLRSGYYVIKVHVLSSDDNLYLDADFRDELVVHSANFQVSTQIATPEFVFVEEDGKYKLDITTVEYGGEYTINVDGREVGQKALDKKVWDEQNPGHIEYEFDVDFAQSKTYLITVSAKAGALYDTAIHLESSAGAINLTRVAQTDISLDLGKDYYGRVSQHMLYAQMPANVADIKAYRGTGQDRSEVVIGYNNNTKQYWLNMADVNIYGSDFGLYFVNVAKADEGKNYYIDSVEKQFIFQRLASPTNVQYKDGVLSFVNNDTRTQNYSINITITKNQNGTDENYYYSFEHDSTSINLQQKVEQLCSQNTGFKTAYLGMDYLSVNVTALQSKEIESVCVLPSFESSSVIIEDLPAVTVAFDWETQTLSWTGGVDGGRYDLYINNSNSPAMVDLANTQIKLSEITGLDLSQVQELSVVSKHSLYFDSKISNSIKVKQLQNVESVVVSKQSGYKASLAIPSDNASVDKVLVNGSAVTFNTSSASAEFDLAGSGNYSIVLKAKETAVDGIYYLSSDPISFDCQEVGPVTVRINGEKILWNDPSVNIMKGHSASPYIFQVTFKDGNVSATIETTETELVINEIESMFSLDLDDTTEDFEISVKIAFVQNYTLDLSQSAVGLIGERESTNVVKPSKLISVNDLRMKVVDLDAESWVDKKVNGNVHFEFSDHWAGFSDAKLHVLIGQNPLNMPLRNGFSIPGSYTLTKSNTNVWTLSVPLSQIEDFSSTVSFAVSCAGNITSDTRGLSLTGFDAVGQMSMSPEGILTIDDAQEGASYAVELRFGANIKSATFEQSQIASIDFTTTDWLGAFGSGDYTITVVAFDQNGQKLPSSAKQTYSAHQFTGISEVYVDDQGKIALALDQDSFDGAIFTAKTTINEKTYSKQITPVEETADNGKTGYKFALTMTDLIQTFKDEFDADGVDLYRNYDFAFTVRGEGGANCQWKGLAFSYSAESAAVIYGRETYDKDYIVFEDISMQNQTTYAFKVDVEITKDNGGAASTQNKTTYYYGLTESDNLTLLKGYWIESAQNGSHFSTTDDSVAGERVTNCYALSVNDILAEYDYGSFAINVARVCVDDSDNFTQYQTFTFSGYKLNEISSNSLRLVDGYNITWHWNKKDTTESAVSAGSYYVIVDDGINVKKFQTSLAIYDLRTCGLSANTQYTISVVAINSRADVVSSNATQFKEISQYASPSNFKFDEGMIGFDISSTLLTQGTLFGDVVTAFLSGGNTSDYQAILENTYTVPYTGKAANYHTPKVKLTFTTINGDGSEGRRYDITMPAIDLIMDCNIPLVGDSLKETFKNNAGALASTPLKNFAQAFANSGEGLASTQTLFDDRGAQIPKGVYEVSMVQLGDGNNIESLATTSMRVYLSPSPKIDISQETFEGEANQFTITVTPNSAATTNDKVTFTEIGAQAYKMYLRTEGKETIAIDLQYSMASHSWGAWYDSTDLNSVDGNIILTTATKNSYGIEQFKMNISKLRNILNSVLDEENQILAGVNYSVDILASSTDDNVLNGKSGKFTLNYQDIDVSKLKIQGGEISIQASFEGELIVRYAYATSQGTSNAEDMPLSVGDNILDLSCIENSGNLAYLSMAVKGSYSYNTIKVESEVYGILNPYKLSLPSVSSINNNLRIEYSSSDLNASVLDSMGGNIAYVVENSQGFSHSSNITQNRVDYSAGLAQQDDKSDVFYAYLKGNNGQFAALKPGDAGYSASTYYKYQLVFDGDIDSRIVLRSEASSINARMIDYQIDQPQRGIVDGGHLKFTIPTNDTSAIVNSAGQHVQTLYRVIIDYYQTQDEGMPEQMLDSKTIYFTQSFVENNVLTIDGQYIDRSYDYAKVSVSAVVASLQASATASTIQTVDGKNFTLADKFTYPDSAFVLSSKTFKTGKLEHTSAVEAPAVTSAKLLMESGKINFVVDKDYADARKIYVVAVDGEGKKVVLDGTYQFASISGQADKMMATFTPADFEDASKLQLLKGNSFNIEIMTYDQNKIISTPLNISSVYKMPDIEGGYEVKVREEKANGQTIGYQTYIDFQKYFDNFKVSSSNSFYQIKVTTTQTNQQSGDEYKATYSLSANNHILVLNEFITELEIQAVDSQPYETVNRVNLINSDKLIVQIKKTEYLDGQIAWDSENYLFTWTGGQADEEYEFFYKIVVRQTNTTIEKSGITAQNSFAPQDMGTIISFMIQARNKALTDGRDRVIYLFSPSIEAPSGSYAFNLFASGDGTEANPYIIKSVANNAQMTAQKQFLSISKRNNEGVYFKLMENIEIEMGMTSEISTFKANLIGNGMTIKFVAKQTQTLPTVHWFKFAIKAQQKNFVITKYASLFHTIAPTASVNGVKIDCQTSLTLDGGVSMVSSLCMFNYGRVDNVTITANKISLSGNSENTLFVGGIVGVNYGSISGCKNEAVELASVAQSLTMTILYSGVACQNATTTYNENKYVGELFNCVNSANINFRMRSGTFYVGAITIANEGNVLACANKGNISCEASLLSTTGTFYIGGIAIYNSGEGKINYCFNSGNITTINANTGATLVAGIVVSYNNGTTVGLVDTAGNTLAAYCGGVTTQKSYVKEGVTVNPPLTAQWLSSSSQITISGTVSFRGQNLSVAMQISNLSVSFAISG